MFIIRLSISVLFAFSLFQCRTTDKNKRSSKAASVATTESLCENIKGNTSKVQFCTAWNRIKLTRYDGKMPSFDDRKSGVKSLIVPSLNSKSFAGGESMQDRPKGIHSLGAISAVRWVPTDEPNPYTGVFKTGANLGLLRISIAVKYHDYIIDSPNPGVVGSFISGLEHASTILPSQTPFSNNYTPGMALKLYIPNVDDSHKHQDSVNLHVMYGVDGQNSRNFFEHNFSNIIPKPISVKAIAGAHFFSRGLAYIHAKNTSANHLTVEHLAKVDGIGNVVATPVAPTKLLFVPAAGLKAKYEELFNEKKGYIPGDDDPDLRTIMAAPDFGLYKTLYEVWARKDPAPDDENNDMDPKTTAFVKIAEIQKVNDPSTVIPFIASKFGDNELHFGHHTEISK